MVIITGTTMQIIIETYGKKSAPNLERRISIRCYTYGCRWKKSYPAVDLVCCIKTHKIRQDLRDGGQPTGNVELSENASGAM
jgi:hypothetical protein